MTTQRNKEKQEHIVIKGRQTYERNTQKSCVCFFSRAKHINNHFLFFCFHWIHLFLHNTEHHTTITVSLLCCLVIYILICDHVCN